jgi:Na+-transporting methylmalonyl-CoA/oxaloacetate decarboxylase gamma subunit
MRHIRWLAVIPFIGMFIGPVLHNSTTPFILGMPFILGWLVIWVLLTSAIMAVIYRLDPVRLAAEEDAP